MDIQLELYKYLYYQKETNGKQEEDAYGMEEPNQDRTGHSESVCFTRCLFCSALFHQLLSEQ